MMTAGETGDGVPVGAIRVDYLTLSSDINHDGSVYVPEGYTSERTAEYRVGPMWYKGVLYEYDCGSLQHLKESERGLLLYRISGSLCEKVLPGIPLEYFNITRIDLCVDVFDAVPLRHYYQEQLDSHRGSASLIKDQTLYIGSRVSDRFWRIYDKAAQMGLPPPLTRIELELKGQRAKQARAHLMAGNREGLFRASAIGCVPEILDTHWKEFRGGTLDLSLPRKPRAGQRYLEKVVAPFLHNNPWAVSWLRINGYLNVRGERDDGDM